MNTTEIADERPRTKVAVVVRDDLENWQAVNIASFLVSGLVGADPELTGEAYVDGDDVQYLSMLRQPVLVFSGSGEVLRSVHGRALSRGLPISIFTSELFSTGNDADNRAAVAAVRTEDLDLVGIGLHGPKNHVDKIIKGTAMYR